MRLRDGGIMVEAGEFYVAEFLAVEVGVADVGVAEGDLPEVLVAEVSL